MKVERKKEEPKFEPIVVTLETKEEADLIWHRLNNNKDWLSYCGSMHMDYCSSLVSRMWGKFDSVYPLR